MFIASLLGGAIGDALGYTVEFMRLNEIKSKFGESGITDLKVDPISGKALISDDTQMTLFTADGILWAHMRCSERGIGTYAGSGIYQSYLRWYYTQTKRLPTEDDQVWLKSRIHERTDSILNYKELYVRRAPGNSCLTALGSGKMGTIEKPINNSKGCGGVMRVAPVGLFLHREPAHAFKVATELAAITHGHPTGYLSAGAFAAIISELINGKTIIESMMTTTNLLKGYKGHEETLQSIEKSIALADSSESPKQAIKQMGEGWIADEALAIALYCALKESNVKEALIMSVNHDGDSDSTGSICGNILGAAHGIEALDQEWINKVELKDLIVKNASDLFDLHECAFNGR
ncbi:ADP-ribosylglycohydrolase family protein [Haloplasma contractile]|uniref:ADP-ribosylglycohydrolase domain containing protein n=1 Tax=Haloplasma contractile SSD-17B TaxID=1033810 RepID=U2FG94_9MOLU|nr:ADP-ribosylglycohydrolase family protein [Haloplasma contractile]ERJ11905.1 ADP-ribosylglycohydrolase domain containing protein [Haloplasma contractile SSD-17B]